MIRRCRQPLFVCLLALMTVLGGQMAAFAAGRASADNALQGVRLERQGESIRVTLDLAAESKPKFFMLERPLRAVIDLPQSAGSPVAKLPTASGAIRALRTGPQANGDLRLVVELAPGARVDWQAIQSPQRRFEFTVVAAAGALAAAGETSRVAIAPAAPPAPPVTPVESVTEKPLKAIRTEHAPPTAGREVIVAIDAGHGGQDPGAIGRGGTREKDVVLDISRQLAERINREPGMRAVLTRDGDYFLTLRQRIKRAREANAELFVSVHADSVRNPTVSGSSVYVLSLKGATDEQARWLADRENAADLAGGVSLEDKDPVIASVLVDLAQSAQISQSMVAAERVLRALGRVNDVRKPQVQQAGFVVLKSPDIPSMLVETAFISSPADERLLGKADRREALAEAIFDGVRQYFVDHPPDGSRFALARSTQRQVIATADDAAGATAGKL